MQVVVHDRTDELPNSLRLYTERRLNRLTRHFDRVLAAEVEFSQDSQRGPSSRRVVQIVVLVDGRKHPLIRARESAPSARVAVDLALDKVDRQVTRLKEKIKLERKRSTALAVGAVSDEPPRPPERLEPERIRLRLRPESLADAERTLESNGHGFHVYLDEDTGSVNVLYRRADGSFAVIEPVVP